MRVLRPLEGVYAFYDGRVEGYRHAEEPNWVDEGALSVGIASYAIVSGDAALVYDTHVSVEHARIVRKALEAGGARTFTVVLSHWHLDHIAGTEAFADCEVIASERTAEMMARLRSAIERGEQEGPPGIEPLIMPTRTFRDRLGLEIGAVHLELIHTDIHSDDAALVWWPERRLLLAGDTMEDTITFVDDPGSLDVHVANLDRLAELGPERILPNHGDPEVIAAGGYPADLIAATQDYIRALKRCRDESALRDLPLRDLIANSLEAGALNYYAPYEDVHRENLKTLLGDRPW
jgi:cyclase